MENSQRDRVSKEYSHVVENAAAARPCEFVITIPRGFSLEQPDEQLVKEQLVLQEFEKLVLKVELASRNRCT